MYFEKLHLKIWQWFPQTCEASFFLLPLYSKDVFHYDCYLWTQNLDIYLLQLNSSPPSSHLISSFMSPASLLSHFTDMCLCALIPSFSLALDNGSGGCFWYSFLSFFCTAFVLLFPGNQKNLFILFILSCRAHNVNLSWNLYRSEETETQLDVAIYLDFFVFVYEQFLYFFFFLKLSLQ